MQNDFNFCPSCGGKKIFNINSRKWKCSDCGFTLYNNVAAAVGIIIMDEQHNVLFEVRAKEPQKGLLAIPGGFCDPDETAEQAAVRECREELGLDLEQTALTYLCSFPNTYDYKQVRYKTCDLFFTATVQASESEPLLSRLRRQESEVTDFVTQQVTSIQDIQNLPIAFESTRKTLLLWLDRKLHHD